MRLLEVLILVVCPALLLVSGIATLVRARARLKHVNLLGAATLIAITLASMALHYWLIRQRETVCGPHQWEHGGIPESTRYCIAVAAFRAAIAPFAALFVLQRAGHWQRALVAAMLVGFYPPAGVSGAATLGFLVVAAGIAEFRRRRHWSNVSLVVASLIPAVVFLVIEPDPVWTALVLGVVIASRWLPEGAPGVGRWVEWGIGVASVSVAVIHMVHDLEQPELFRPHDRGVGFHDVHACPPPEFRWPPN